MLIAPVLSGPETFTVEPSAAHTNADVIPSPVPCVEPSAPQTAVAMAERSPAAARTMKGMTLIEIMIVVAIIAMVMGGVGVAAVGQWEKARVKTAQQDLLQLSLLVDQFRVDHRGRCPADLAALRAAGLAKTIRQDPWGNDYAFKCDGVDVTVTSAGPDAEPETEDDLTTDKPLEDA